MRKKVMVALSVYGGILLFWGLSSIWNSWLPSPFMVTRRVISQLPAFIQHVSFTARTMGWSLLLAFLVALPLAWLMVQLSWIRVAMNSFLLIFQCLPMFALAPLMILCFGWTQIAVIIPTALMMIFPLVSNMTKGFLTVPAEYGNLLVLHGANRRDLFFKLKLPYALPFVFAGLRVAVSFSGVGAVASEFAGAQKGVGVFLQECRRDLDLEGVLGGLVMLLSLTMVFYAALYLLERFFCKGERFE